MASPAPGPSTSTQNLVNMTTRSSEEEHTYVSDDGFPEHEQRPFQPYGSADSEHYLRTQPSPSQTRAQERRLDDDLAMLQAEQHVSDTQNELKKSNSLVRSRSRRTDPVDEFDVNTNPIHERNAGYRPPENPSTRLARLFKKIHNSSFLVRYFMYIIPVTALLLIPLLFGALLFKDAHVGGVELLWFSIWLEIVWLTLWAGRIAAKMVPWPLGLISSLFTNNSKKWRDMGKQLELPGTLFFWWLGIEISFLPTMTSHMISNYAGDRTWMDTVNKIIVSIFIGVTLNFAEKVIIQLIAISFHLRTYQDRIEINKFQIGSLAKLYEYSRTKIEADDSDFEDNPNQSGPGSGNRTPMQYLEKAQKNVTSGFRKVGDVAGKVAGDFTGKQITQSTHPNQVILVLLNSTSGSQVLARRLYRTFVHEDVDTVSAEDMKPAFNNSDEADAAFSMFDKDMNGDISMDELEAVCVEIGRERKSITASLKDLDSVVSKLDGVLLFIVICVTVLVFITLISTSAAGVLTSAGSTVLALSWLFSATAQEFLQSVIFVFVKHPFDVGDRVSVYGNTGSSMKGDDYFVKEISLLYTEFKKMEGHVVQAPNSYLNTLFILNVRRSGGLAEAVPLTVKFGTTLEQVDELRGRLLDFVKAEKREYQGNILTEIREVVEAYSVNLNVVFFYKSNWQNELLRLQRRNKFICALMVSMQEIGIEGPRSRQPGAKEALPFYVHSLVPGANGPAPSNPKAPSDGSVQPDLHPDAAAAGPAPFPSPGQQPLRLHHGSILRRPRGESASSMSKRVDFSLGMKDISSGNLMGDVYEDRRPLQVPSRDRDASGSRSRARASEDGGVSLGRARSSAHEHPSHGHLGLHRASTESQAAGGAGGQLGHALSRRNRFFSRGSRETGRSDADDQRLMEQGMAAIPEGGTAPASAAGSGRPSHGSDTRVQVPMPPMPEPGLQRNLAGRGQGGYEMSRLRD